MSKYGFNLKFVTKHLVKYLQPKYLKILRFSQLRKIYLLQSRNHWNDSAKSSFFLQFHGFSPHDYFDEPKTVIAMEFATCNLVKRQIELEHRSQAGPWNDTKNLICICSLAPGIPVFIFK